MSRKATPRLRAALWLTAVGIVASLAAGRPEPVAVAAPFALLAVAGLAERRPRPFEASLRLERERAHEGERIHGELELSSASASDRLEAVLDVAAGVVLEQEQNRALTLQPGERRTLDVALRCDHWGAQTGLHLRVRRYDRLRLVADEQDLMLDAQLRIYPHIDALRALARPFETQAAVGDQVARVKGDGIELAELRPFVPGDELRRVNWRASARTGELVVNQHHPERNTAVLLFLDTFAEVAKTSIGPLDQSVRAAAALAQRYLARRNRVGLMVVGGRVRWLRPASGAAQVHRIVDTLLEARATGSRPGDETTFAFPDRTIPPRALVLALSPLLEERIVHKLVELRGRGFDVAVVEVSPLPFLEILGEKEELALRLLRLERDLLRSRLRERGIAVVEWTEGESLETAIRTTEEFRRRARVVRS